MSRTTSYDADGYCMECRVMATLPQGSDLMCERCPPPKTGITDYERGQWAAFNRVLNLLTTYEDAAIRRGRFHADIMELRPIPED